MKKLISKISQIVRWAMAIFFGTTILTVVVLKFFPVYYTPLMFIRLFQLDEVKLSHEWVSIDEISPSMPLAVMGSEDANFQEHWGFDFKAIQDAAEGHPPLANRLPRTYSSGLAVRGYERDWKPISLY